MQSQLNPNAYEYYYHQPYPPVATTPSSTISPMTSTPTTPEQAVILQQPIFQFPIPMVYSPSQPQSPQDVSFMPTNYHRRKCSGADNMGTQCLPRVHSEGVWECMYCGVLLLLYLPGEQAHLLPYPHHL